MKKALIAALLMTTFAMAKPAPLVVDSAWLAKHLDDPELVLLHVGDKAGYDAGHIKGARQVTLQDLHVSDHEGKGLILEMPALDDLKKRLESFGISNDSRIVVYYGKDWVSPSTRIIFTLDYAGLGDRASLLDGGMSAWVKAGNPIVIEATEAKKGTLKPLAIKPIVVDAEFVRNNVGRKGIALVDGRASVFYDGVDTGGSHDTKHRTGHIAGAGSVPFTSITNDDLTLKSAEEWRALLTKGGVKPGDTVVGYCHIGMQTTAVLFAARSLGHKVLLYDGSFQDWSRHPDYPVENPAEKAGR
jgi:thiosulfate/3-mercaptopyruvate sulfurtransferase